MLWAKQPHAFCGPTRRPSSHLGRPDPSWPKQRACCFLTAIRSEQSDRFTITGAVISLDSHLHYGSAILTAAHTHPGQTHGAYLVPPGSIATAEPPIEGAQQQRPQNEGQQVPRPVAA
ncbi:unnamed protein product [Prunus brigantina]